MKKGVRYEETVKKIISLLDPNANVTRGKWIRGPDGVREIDVLVDGEIKGKRLKIAIECKDYKKKRRIGIKEVDAFESKIRDLNVNAGILCSNADFTKAARSKAVRRRIGLVGVLFKADQEHFWLNDYIETRYVNVDTENVNISLHFREKYIPKHIELDGQKYGNLTGTQLAQLIIVLAIQQSPVVNGVLEISCNFSDCIQTQLIGLTYNLTGISVRCRISGAWLGKHIKIESTSSIYDWLSKKIIPAGETVTCEFKDVPISEIESYLPASKLHDEVRSDGRVAPGFNLIIFSININILENIPRIPKEIDLNKITIKNFSDQLTKSMPKPEFKAILSKQA